MKGMHNGPQFTEDELKKDMKMAMTYSMMNTKSHPTISQVLDTLKYL